MQTITVRLSFRPLWETDASGVLAFLNKAGVCTLHTLKTIYGMVLWDSGVKWKKNLCAWGSGFRGKSSSILTFDSKSTAISKTNTHPQHGILPWPRGSGQQQQLLKCSQLGQSSYTSHASLWWLTFWGKVLALSTVVYSDSSWQGWKLQWNKSMEVVCVWKGKAVFRKLKKKKKKPTFFHIVLPLSAEMPTLLTGKSQQTEKPQKTDYVYGWNNNIRTPHPL